MDETHKQPLNITKVGPNPRHGTSNMTRSKEEEFESAVEVGCDQGREKRCRDKSACYAKEKHCDFEVDCKDNSDEDSCSCLERLIDDRPV